MASKLKRSSRSSRGSRGRPAKAPSRFGNAMAAPLATKTAFMNYVRAVTKAMDGRDEPIYSRDGRIQRAEWFRRQRGRDRQVVVWYDPLLPHEISYRILLGGAIASEETDIRPIPEPDVLGVWLRTTYHERAPTDWVTAHGERAGGLAEIRRRIERVLGHH
jgi:hypothetical protein